MKLEPKAKPVRIRIKSGGEEHFNLESLKRNFSVQDLWEAVIGKSLSRWLKQQNEKELADGVDGFCEIEKPSVDDYVRFSNLFFANETIVDADSLLKFYQSKGLKKNVRSAFLELFDSLNFENGKQWFESFRHLKKAEEWIGFFEQRIDGLENMEAAECHKLLSSLYKERGAFREMSYHQGKSGVILSKLAETDGKLFGELLELGDYQTVKSLFENPDTEGKVDANKWIEVFRIREDSLSDQDKGECLYILYILYEKVQNKEMAKMALSMSNKLGYLKAKMALQSYSSQPQSYSSQSQLNSSQPQSYPSQPQSYSYRYPELVSLLQSYGHNIKKTQLSQIANHIWYLVMKHKGQSHYDNCYYCINMFLEIQSERNYNTISEVMKRRAQETKRPNAEVPLIFLIAGLAWEEKMHNTALFRQNGGIKLRSDYRSIVEAKGQNRYTIITTKNGLKCDTAIDSPIDQMAFFMMSYDEGYEISNR